MTRYILKSSYLTTALPYISLLVWILPLLLLNSQQHSLIAHDEGIYAWRSRWMVEFGDWLNPSIVHYGKTPGIYWLIATSFSLFGIHEAAARLPSIIACTLSVLLIYEIGTIILNKRIGWLAAAILSVEFFWLQYGRLALPDVPLVFLMLLGIWFLLKAELHPKYSLFLAFFSGLSFGLAFLIRSYMIFLPIIALLPYLIWQHCRHRHLFNPMFYGGFVLSFTFTIAWILTSWLKYGSAEFKESLAFLLHLGSDERHGNNFLYYLWNIPAKTFPWAFFSLIGLGVSLHNPIAKYQLILVGVPIILFIEISIFSTRIPHYALSIYPFVALLAAVGLNWLGNIYQNKFSQIKWLPRNLSYAFGGLSCLLVLISLAIVIGLPIPGVKLTPEIQKYGAIALALGLGWLVVPLVWISRHYFGKVFLTSRYWLAAWLLGPWLALAVAGITGLLGDYNPDIKSFLQQPEIAAVVRTNPVNFVNIGGKTGTLLLFYTPIWGQEVENISNLPSSSYAWVKSKTAVTLPSSYQSIGIIREWQLIKKLNPKICTKADS